MLIIRQFISYFFNLPIFLDMEAPAMSKFLAWAFAFVAMSIMVGPIHFFPQTVYYGVCALCVLYIFLQGGITTNGAFFTLYFAMGVSALFCEWAVFKSIPRFILFVMVTIVVSPFIVSDAALKFRNLVFRNLMILSTVFVIGSFFAFFLGINYMTKRSTNLTDTGIFGGLFFHSMTLGPVAAVSAIVFFNSYQLRRDTISIVLFFLSFATVLLSASRGALMALVVPVVYSLFMMQNLHGTKKRIVWLLILASIAIIPMSDRFTKGIRTKQENNEKLGGSFSSRESKWRYRMAEFYSSPVWGVGFAAIDPNIGDSYNPKNGVIEPCTSHLAVLSMTGLLGFVPYLYILIYAFMAVRGDRDGPSRFRRCLFIAFMVHGIVEGYALAGGNMLCVFYWITIGQCVDYKRLEESGMLEEQYIDVVDNEEESFLDHESEDISIRN